jgi:hypothetical protein
MSRVGVSPTLMTVYNGVLDDLRRPDGPVSKIKDQVTDVFLLLV